MLAFILYRIAFIGYSFLDKLVPSFRIIRIHLPACLTHNAYQGFHSVAPRIFYVHSGEHHPTPKQKLGYGKTANHGCSNPQIRNSGSKYTGTPWDIHTAAAWRRYIEEIRSGEMNIARHDKVLWKRVDANRCSHVWKIYGPSLRPLIRCIALFHWVKYLI